jgi:hypothetical protein
MATTISGTNGVSQVQDGIVTQGKLAAASVTDGKLDLTANSAEVKEALNASGAAPIYACRAWVSFTGTGTVAIQASGNISSITDNGTADYSLNFTTAMEDADYACAGMTGQYRSIELREFDQLSSSFLRISTGVNSSSRYDVETCRVAVFR